jgi:WD40 repeat protein
MNTQGLQALLRNVASGSGAMEGDSSSSDDADGPEPLPEDEMRRLMEEAEEDDEDSEDDISSSDSIPSPPNGGSTIYSEVPLVRPVAIYTGHRNVDTVKDVNFGGGDDSLIVSGSDDGNLFIWDKESTNTLVGIWKGDESVVNVMQWHPYLPVLAVSGIDNSVKILAPTQGLLPEGQGKRWASRLDKKEEIEKKNSDSTWSSQGLGIDPNVLLRLLARRQAQGDDEDDEQDDAEGGEGGTRRRTRRIPLQALLQLAHEGTDERGDCRIM